MRRSDLLLLEGRADRVCAGGCIAGTDRDLLCSAIGLAVVVDAILYIALDPLDMLAAILFV